MLLIENRKRENVILQWDITKENCINRVVYGCYNAYLMGFILL